MPSNIESDITGGLAHASVDKGQICFLDRTILKRPAQPRMSPIVFSHNEKAGGPFVDPVDDPGPGFAARAGQAMELEHQAVNESALARSRARMDNQAGRFLDDSQIVIFVDNFEGDILGLQTGPAGRFEIDFNDLVAAQPVPRLLLPVSNTDRPRPVECLNVRAGELDKVAGKEYIQP